ncbi:uncharacterized protein BKCO1_15000151 [Diplodia corticola]|uniref:Uncharacterized protein n=1 Tax=Diplodia corticola TaxID=236234 RepID=A0A1J9S776_9PEZI|nr:uncharacterized protein BKCO1_15000151 [Diplodia corticola]OJD35772.1 hypothetical protein BKCO1_15000151 [Diplodia corticola]
MVELVGLEEVVGDVTDEEVTVLIEVEALGLVEEDPNVEAVVLDDEEPLLLDVEDMLLPELVVVSSWMKMPRAVSGGVVADEVGAGDEVDEVELVADEEAGLVAHEGVELEPVADDLKLLDDGEAEPVAENEEEEVDEDWEVDDAEEEEKVGDPEDEDDDGEEELLLGDVAVVDGADEEEELLLDDVAVVDGADEELEVELVVEAVVGTATHLAAITASDVEEVTVEVTDEVPVEVPVELLDDELVIVLSVEAVVEKEAEVLLDGEVALVEEEEASVLEEENEVPVTEEGEVLVPKEEELEEVLVAELDAVLVELEGVPVSVEVIVLEPEAVSEGVLAGGAVAVEEVMIEVPVELMDDELVVVLSVEAVEEEADMLLVTGEGEVLVLEEELEEELEEVMEPVGFEPNEVLVVKLEEVVLITAEVETVLGSLANMTLAPVNLFSSVLNFSLH